MHDPIDLLRAASEEIKSLRRRNEILAAKAEVVHIFGIALSRNQGGECMAPDISWIIDNHIEELKKVEAKTPESQDKRSPYLCGSCKAEIPYPMTSRVCIACGGDACANGGPLDNPAH